VNRPLGQKGGAPPTAMNLPQSPGLGAIQNSAPINKGPLS
jgi:hypothetical protein